MTALTRLSALQATGHRSPSAVSSVQRPWCNPRVCCVVLRLLAILLSLFAVEARAQADQANPLFESRSGQGLLRSPGLVDQTRGAALAIPERSSLPTVSPTQGAGIPSESGAGTGIPVASPPQEPSEFQKFVEQSSGRLLPRFGANLFSAVPSTFAPLDNVPVTPDYVIGPGDEVLVRYWGQVEGDHRLMVDREGNIQIPRVGAAAVAGVKLQNLGEHLQAIIGRVFQNFELNVSLGRLRSIQIYVVGRARRPGSYTISSLSSLMNALFVSGGPSNTGSMRRIQLKRGDRTVTEFDAYEFLTKGDRSADRPLLSGDVIFIPPEGPQVAMSGSVNVPAIYELKDKASLAEVIELAGGLSTTAAGQKVLLERIVDRRVRRVEEYSLDPAGLAREVRGGDLISVLHVSPRFENAVTLRGNVASPLRYPYRPGMRISDLIPDKDALIVADYYVRRNLATRIAPRSGEPQGEQARRLQPDPGLKGDASLVTDMRRSTLDINWEYAAIERLEQKDLSTTLLPFNLGKAVIDRDPGQDLLLQPGDVVTIFSQRDIAVPVSRRANFVLLEDEFKRPGLYRAEPGETLRQLVIRLGGVSPNAYLFGAVFTRESTRLAQQKSLEEAINRMEIEAQRSQAQAAQALSVDAESLKQQALARQAVLTRMRQLKSNGRIILNLPAEAGLANIPDVPLEDGDRLQIPSRPSTVQVIGAVQREGTLVFRPDQRVTDYLMQAGGATRSADLASAYILRADGSVLSRRQSAWLISTFESERLMPGDAIVVPEDFDQTSWTRTLKDWAQIFYQFGLGAAALKVLKN